MFEVGMEIWEHLFMISNREFGHFQHALPHTYSIPGPLFNWEYMLMKTASSFLSNNIHILYFAELLSSSVKKMEVFPPCPIGSVAFSAEPPTLPASKEQSKSGCQG